MVYFNLFGGEDNNTGFYNFLQDCTVRVSEAAARYWGNMPEHERELFSSVNMGQSPAEDGCCRKPRKTCPRPKRKTCKRPRKACPMKRKPCKPRCPKPRCQKPKPRCPAPCKRKPACPRPCPRPRCPKPLPPCCP